MIMKITIIIILLKTFLTVNIDIRRCKAINWLFGLYAIKYIKILNYMAN